MLGTQFTCFIRTKVQILTPVVCARVLDLRSVRAQWVMRVKATGVCVCVCVCVCVRACVCMQVADPAVYSRTLVARE